MKLLANHSTLFSIIIDVILLTKISLNSEGNLRKQRTMKHLLKGIGVSTVITYFCSLMIVFLLAMLASRNTTSCHSFFTLLCLVRCAFTTKRSELQMHIFKQIHSHD